MTTLFSPCVGICDAEGSQRCTGCGRTRAEQQCWRDIPPLFQRRILQRAQRDGILTDDQISRYPEGTFV